MRRVVAFVLTSEIAIRCQECGDFIPPEGLVKNGMVDGKQRYRRICPDCRNEEKRARYEDGIDGETHRESDKYRSKEKMSSRALAKSAVKRGDIERKPCEFKTTSDVDYHVGDVGMHHEDYRKPLEVVWLCRKHHEIADRLREERLKLEESRARTEGANEVPPVQHRVEEQNAERNPDEADLPAVRESGRGQSGSDEDEEGDW